MERESFIFYRSFYEAIRELPDNIRLEVFTAITEYALYGKQPENLKPFARGMFIVIKPNLDANTKRYENGTKGGRKPSSSSVPKTAPAPAEVKESSAPVKSKSRKSDSAATFTSFEAEVAQMKTETIWGESACVQFHIDRKELETRLDAFVTHCHVERGDQLHSSIADARRHFTSWMRKAYPASTSKTPEPRPDDYTYNGGFGSVDV